MQDHLNSANASSQECEFECSDCNYQFASRYCNKSHKVNKLSGKIGNYCNFLSQLRNCQLCIQDFELTSRCRHFGNKIRAHRASEKKRKSDDETLIGSVNTGENDNYVKCGFCSGFYLRGTTTHSCFLRPSDSIFGNSSHCSSTIKSHNVFYYDIESRLETYYECKVEKPETFDEFGNLVI